MQSERAGKEDISVKCVFMVTKSETVRGGEEGATVGVINHDNENQQLPVLMHASGNSANSDQ